LAGFQVTLIGRFCVTPEVPELKDFVDIEGIHPNSTLSVTEELRDALRRKAMHFLAAQ
jgi:hypothetical protein